MCWFFPNRVLSNHRWMIAQTQWTRAMTTKTQLTTKPSLTGTSVWIQIVCSYESALNVNWAYCFECRQMQRCSTRRFGERVSRRPPAEPVAVALSAAFGRLGCGRGRRTAGVAASRVRHPRAGRHCRGLLLGHDAAPAAARAVSCLLPRRPQAARALHHLLDHLALLALHRLAAARALSEATRATGMPRCRCLFRLVAQRVDSQRVFDLCTDFLPRSNCSF